MSAASQPLRVGDRALDPMNRRVTIVAIEDGMATVEMGVFDTYTARYPVSCLSPVESSR